MRPTVRHVLLVLALLTVLALAADTATAAEVGSEQIATCRTSSGGAMTVCF